MPPSLEQNLWHDKTTGRDERKEHKPISSPPTLNFQHGLDPSLLRCKNPPKHGYIQNLASIRMKVGSLYEKVQ